MRLPRPHASQGLRFQENFAYGAYGPGFTEKLRMGLRGGGTTKFEHQFDFIRNIEHLRTKPEHQFD